MKENERKIIDTLAYYLSGVCSQFSILEKGRRKFERETTTNFKPKAFYYAIFLRIGSDNDKIELNFNQKSTMDLFIHSTHLGEDH